MLAAESGRGNVVVLADTEEIADRLGRWIAAAGERPVVLSGVASVLMDSGDDDSVDLLVTDLDSDDPAARALLDRLLSGELLRGVPAIHLFRDLSFRHDVLLRAPHQSALCLPAPPEAEDFQARVRLAAEIGRLRRELSRSTIRDPMTGLYNRRYVVHRMEEELSRSRRYHAPLSLVLVDIDHLKNVNDAFGQVAGDSVIQRVAQLIRKQVRREDILGRTGEESFSIVLHGNRYRGAAVLANKIRTETEDLSVSFDGHTLPVRVSAGISTYPDNPAIRGVDDLVRTTENALAQAKARGGNRVFIDEGVLGHRRRTVLVADPDTTLLDLAEDLLALDDLAVVRAVSAEAAVAALRAGRPDLVVLDLRMSDGETSLLERIPEIHPGGRIPVIGLAREAGADPDGLARLGVDRFITKPFSLSLLRSLAGELLDAYRPA